MKPLRHAFIGILRTGLFILIYLFSIFLLSCFFGSVYEKYGVQNAFQLSFDVIWGNPKVPEKIHRLVTFQKMVYEVFLVFLAGNYVSQQLKPINPINYSKYIAYNYEENCYYFRYWILLPKGKFFFSAKARLIITEQKELNRGINKLSSQFEKEEVYDSIRGVRYFKIAGADADRFISALERGKSCIISLYIIGTNDSGITYASVKRYKTTDIKRGYGFVSIRESEYVNQAKPLKKRRHRNQKEFIRFQHFDKLYRLDGKRVKSKDVLTKKEILYGQYRGIRQWMLDFISWLTTLVLGK